MKKNVNKYHSFKLNLDINIHLICRLLCTRYDLRGRSLGLSRPAGGLGTDVSAFLIDEILILYIFKSIEKQARSSEKEKVRQRPVRLTDVGQVRLTNRRLASSKRPG